MQNTGLKKNKKIHRKLTNHTVFLEPAQPIGTMMFQREITYKELIIIAVIFKKYEDYYSNDAVFLFFKFIVIPGSKCIQNNPASVLSFSFYQYQVNFRIKTWGGLFQI